MKYAIFGDIHANLEALEAVMLDAANRDCTDFVCIGDIVGYNANPRECLEFVQNLGCPVVRGNHDEEAALDSPLEGLNPLAKHALEWTRRQLTAENREWLMNLKLVRQVRDFTIVHATLDTPGNWGYVTNKFDAMASFSYQFTPVCFYGHTHTPRIYIKGSSVEGLEDFSTPIELGRKYFINVGSVGQPRDGDWRSSYATYDVENQRVAVHRLEYDLATAQRKILDAGLPEMLANRLAVGK
ncbi:MAG: metallophosphoesterase family protein [Verrucomicrobiae bacterium]|nr:metallophosphoesterase family protein [Verrucomicrobiae bacterium]MCP5538989.1 metallophosphoesterase family protein [Akkermansiaceae bacterium]MCP5550624.1 metallophosphoesterase family protein [Akkermansiaceae bacterium]